MPVRLIYVVSAVGFATIMFYLNHKLAAFLWLGGHALSYQIHLLSSKLDRLLDARRPPRSE